MPSRSLLRAAVAACAAVIPSLAAAQTLTFDLASSFNTFNLAGSPFAAGYYSNYGDALTPYTDRAVLAFNNGQTLQALSTGNYANGARYTPGVFLAGAAGVDDPSFTPTFGPNVLGLHPGSQGEISVIRFTAPITGTYSFNAFSYGLDRTGNTTTESNLVFYIGGESYPYGGTVYGYGPTDSGSLTQAVYDLNRGEFVDFAVTDGGDGYQYDMTALDAQVEVDAAVTATPEPATVALVGAGVLALGAAARRRRHA